VDRHRALSDGETSEDRLLGGRVRLVQPRRGFRAAIDPVLLAAAVPARPGERVLEAGLGTGAAALCLIARVSGLRVTGIERDPALAALAATNAARNGAGRRVAVIAGDLTARNTARAAAALGPYAHAMANPPFHRDGTPSPHPARRAAGHASPDAELGQWIAALARRLAPRGTITLILPPARLPDALGACAAAGIGGLTLVPLWPRAGEAAKRVIVQGSKGSRAPVRLAAGLVLHQADGRYTEAAERILRDGAPCRSAERGEDQG
jgi:tRNA1(Val) A37 N6-methylase TrmN6